MSVTKALVAAAAKAAGKTSADEAARRAICEKCPRIGLPDKPLEFAALALSGGTHVCKVCGCGINLLASTLDQLLPEDSPEHKKERPETCWYPKKDKE